MQNCKLKITGGQAGEKETVELYTNGSVSFDNGTTVIEYDDGESDDNSVNRVIISGDVVTMSRLGAFTQTLIFEKGKSFSTLIPTTVGMLPLSIYSSSVVTDVKDDKTTVNLSYSMDFNGNSSENEMTLEAYY